MPTNSNQAVGQGFRASAAAYGAITIAVLILALFFQADSGRSWANYADQELTLAYNAILLLSGGRQELYDHTGFLTIYLLGKYMQLKSHFYEGMILNIGQLNAQSYFDTFHKLVSYSREFAAVSVFLLVLTVFLLLVLAGIAYVPSLLVSIAYAFSSGVVVHFEQLRTELLSVVVLIFSACAFAIARDASGKVSYKVTATSLVLLIIAIVNKIQVIIFCLVYFYGFMIFLSRETHAVRAGGATLDACLKPKRNSFHLMMILLVYSLLLLKGATSWFSILIMIIFFVGGGLLLSMHLAPSHLQGLRNFRLTAGLRFGALYTAALLGAFLLTMPFARNPLIFIQVVNPSNLFLYSSHSEITNDLLVRLLLSPVTNILDLRNTSWVYLLCGLAALALARKRLVMFDVWAFFYFVAAFYFIDLTSSVRYLAPQYRIYSEFHLLMLLVYFVRLVPRPTQRVVIVFAVLLCSLSITARGTVQKLQTSFGNERTYCTSSFVKDWHKKIDVESFYRECAAAGF